MSQRHYFVGQRVRVVSVHHPVFNSLIGSQHIIKKLAGDGLAWCQPDKLFPRRKRDGTVVMEQPHWTTLYSLDQLMDAVEAERLLAAPDSQKSYTGGA